MTEKKYIIDNAELMAEWDREKNNNIGIDPQTLTSGSHKKAFWKCFKGHEWAEIIETRSRGYKCPYCSGKRPIIGETDFATVHPELLKEWNYNKNTFQPTELLPNSSKKAWWKCEHGHEWEATLNNRHRGTGCPECKNQRISVKKSIPPLGKSLFDLNPDLAKEWHPSKNGSLTPNEVFSKSRKKVWWKCSLGHEWEATINSRNCGSGCPICQKELQTSFPEQAIYFYIKQLFFDTVNRYIDNGKELDVFIPSLNIGIEYDGMYFHTSKSKEKEFGKDEYFNSKSITVIRVKELRDKESPICFNKNIVYYSPVGHYKYLPEVISCLINYIYAKLGKSAPEIDICLERDTGLIYQSYLSVLKENSILTDEKLSKEWNYEKNGGLNPQYISISSGKTVWWKCEKGHEWQASIYSRNAGNGCPYCANHKLLKGYNDLSTIAPDIAKEWHYEKNGDLLPEDVIAKTDRSVWWKCNKGHEWKARISNRMNGNNCPYCANKKVVAGDNDLKTWCEQNNMMHLIQEFDCEKNDFDITEITPSSGKMVWWRCSNNHSYATLLTHRTNMHTSCPFCSNKKLLPGYNDLSTTHPEIAQEWDYAKNNGITPSDVMAGSNNKKYWFVCENGHSYSSNLLNRKKGRGCPICRKNKKD